MPSFERTTSFRTPDQEASRLYMALSLARYIAERRKKLGLTVSAAADLAGLQISEWDGLEQGWIPEDLATLRAVAGVLQVYWSDFHRLAFVAGCYRWC